MSDDAARQFFIRLRRYAWVCFVACVFIFTAVLIVTSARG